MSHFGSSWISYSSLAKAVNTPFTTAPAYIITAVFITGVQGELKLRVTPGGPALNGLPGVVGGTHDDESVGVKEAVGRQQVAGVDEDAMGGASQREPRGLSATCPVCSEAGPEEGGSGKEATVGMGPRWGHAHLE
ncbi:hypothetical protein K438DRAFT_1766204 [Mycena galopus ATCC 62051]|nr:hypothetical protein K438DRAFT_1766204 [Mycena galopus ATCC 62051]